MIKGKKYLKKGFTFMEIMIVVAIIGVLASVVIVSMSAAKKRNENAAIMTMVKDYEKAIYDFMYLSNNGNYPRIYDAADLIAPQNDCLGPDGTCWNSSTLGRSSDIDSGGANPDIQDYIQDLPSKNVLCSGASIEVPMIEQNLSVNNPPRIYFFVRDDNCAIGEISGFPGIGGCTLCYIDIQK